MFTRKMVDRTLIRRNKERTYWHNSRLIQRTIWLNVKKRKTYDLIKKKSLQEEPAR